MILTAWLAWALPLLAVPLVPISSLVDGRLRGWVAVSASGLSLAAALFTAVQFTSPSYDSLALWLPGLSVPLQVQVDGLSVLVSLFVSFVSFLVVVYSLGYMKEERGLTRYYSLVLLFVGSMLGLVMAGNLIQFYFFWEIVGVCSALLIAFWTDREAARKAGMKAFVVTRVGDASLLLGVLILATLLGTTSFTVVASPFVGFTLGAPVTFLVGVLVVLGAMGKSAQVPLHVWLPDAMEGPTPVSALIHAATMVNAGVYLLLRTFPLLQAAGVLNFVLVIGLASALLGGACALAANDLKRVLAYSTISQLGLMFAAVGLGSWTAAAYHMVGQGLFKALAFLAAGWVAIALGTRDMDSMGGLRRGMKYTYAAFAVAVLAMSGLPPLVGSWSKDAILALALSASWPAALLLVLASSLTVLYSFRALFRVFHGTPRSGKSPGEAPVSMRAPMLVLVVSLVVGWIILGSQGLVSFSQFSTLDPLTLAVSLGVLAAFSASSYLATLKYRARAAAILSSSRVLGGLREFLAAGMGFDSLYAAAYSAVLSRLSRLASSLQTGLLRSNAALLLLVLLALFVLFATGGI